MICRLGTVIFYAAFQNRDVRRTQQVMAEYYRRSCPELEYVSPQLVHGKGERTGEKIKIGFVSAYLNNHTIGKLYGGLVAALDDDRFEITIFASSHASDEITAQLRHEAGRFVVLPGSLQGKRAAMESIAPDILFYPDIGMTTETYFLAFSRLAPVQCAGLGHPVTTGIPAMDYYISGAEIEPDGAEEYYTEELIALPTLPFAVWPINIGAETPSLEMDFARDKTLYACVQSLFKVHPDFDEILRGILERDENGAVVFIEGMPGWSDALRARWAKSIPEVANRIHFMRRLNQTEFLSLIHRADILLDTVHFCGGNTTAETLGMGKIVITWPGDYAAGRVTAAYYRQLGIEDAIASSAEEYIDLAVSLSRKTERRAELEKRIAQAAPVLFDHRDIGAAYGEFFERALHDKALRR
jgi:protein O-GlcNAc transferase